ncbi:hypothetical protein GCM10010430_78780 [Kitasatospora cystarginea]|uniref:HTH iclR-type domain-containing protein n=2 Tax=Kitasatospora cystarginea TaxID=58350 RepID=A0ABN3F1Q9_9ACTN
MTRPTVEVLRLLLATRPHEPLWAARISEQTALGRSTVSQILARLTERQWVALCREQGSHAGRPARVLCVLTRQGCREARRWRHGAWLTVTGRAPGRRRRLTTRRPVRARHAAEGGATGCTI